MYAKLGPSPKQLLLLSCLCSAAGLVSAPGILQRGPAAQGIVRLWIGLVVFLVVMVKAVTGSLSFGNYRRVFVRPCSIFRTHGNNFQAATVKSGHRDQEVLHPILFNPHKSEAIFRDMRCLRRAGPTGFSC